VLEVRGLTAGYGPVRVLRGVDVTVGTGEIMAMIGPNGAGKTTTLNAIAGVLPRGGEILLDGEPLAPAAEQVVRRGVALVPQGRKVFPRMTVEENLFMGAYSKGGTWRDFERRAEPIFSIFPRLAERRTQIAGSLSGGEQQMLAVARALMSRPTLLLLDEPSLGLAPIIVQGLFQRFGEMNKNEGITMLIVEQNANLALDIADRAYVLEAGETVLTGTADDLRHDDGVRKAYLGY
jgi:branched-chain amino acid transport system ATP-binding protein